MNYMYNCFNIVPIIFEETRAKRRSESDNITVDKRYQDDCWFFLTTRCKWDQLCLKEPFLLTNFDGNDHLPRLLHIEEMDVDIDIPTQIKAHQETEEEARREYTRKEQAFQMAQGTELTSQDMYGQETTTPGGELTEPQIQLTQPKAETAKEPEDTKKMIKVIVEETPLPTVVASIPHSTGRVEETDGSDYAVEVEDKISAISNEEEPTEQRLGRINHPQIQAMMAKLSLMEIECSMIITASFGTVGPPGAPHLPPQFVQMQCSLFNPPELLQHPQEFGCWFNLHCPPRQ
uniref:Uncharacterized protein n=1 Tax=Romanomermis culicivorax TaxID=13658 RepID=A0A915K5Q4_ROMCU